MLYNLTESLPRQRFLSFEDEHNHFEDEESDELMLPNYDEAFYLKNSFDSTAEILPQTPTPDSVLQSIVFDDRCDSPDSDDSISFDAPSPQISKDDIFITPKSLYNVDYLSYRWNAEELWASRKLVMKEKDKIQDVPVQRLENTLWRTWAKTFHQLPACTPEEVEWQKDSDITWLYGPVICIAQKTSPSHHYLSSDSKSNAGSSASMGIKSSLKKRNTAQEILRLPAGATFNKSVTFELYVNAIVW